MSEKNNYEDKWHTYIKNDSGFERKERRRGRFFKYLSIGVICAILGGAGASYGIMYALPNTEFFKNTPLYEEILKNQNVTTGAPKVTSTDYKIVAGETVNIPKVVEKVSSAVVGVQIKGMSTDNFFGVPTEVSGIGSGIIFSEEGYILTNYHVINGATEVKVIFNNKKEANAKVINYDANMDVAVIKVTDKITMPGVAEFGDSSALQVGEPAIAIGNPLGKEFLGSVTSGIISAINRGLKVDRGRTMNLIQTDAAINPGNSGGPLLNSKGEVIGINTIKISNSGETSVEGLGFAIPINEVKPKIQDLLKPILKLGVIVTDLNKTLAQKYNYPEGIYVKEVQEFSAAERAGIRPGDVIISFDGKRVKKTEEMNKLKNAHKMGDTVKIELQREVDGKIKTVDLTFEDR